MKAGKGLYNGENWDICAMCNGEGHIDGVSCKYCDGTGYHINCICTHEIICPHCGYQFEDSWEQFNEDCNSIKIKCWNENCQKEFEVEEQTEITYTSYKG